MKRFKLLVLLAGCLCLAACETPDQVARDTAASLQGLIVAAQAQYQTTCTATPTKPVCVNINKAVQGQNLLITSLETYCGWSTTAPPPDPTVACKRVSSAQAALNSAISNANALVTELKAIISAPATAPKPVPAPAPSGGAQ